MADSFQLYHYEFLHGDMSSFNTIVKPATRFDFITCTNTAHELQPGAFASLFLSSLKRLSNTGELFMYDMEYLTKPELGAIPWRIAEINTLLNSAFEELKTDFRVEPSGWTHTSCKGWSVTIQREYINKTDDEIQKLQNCITDRLEREIDKLLEERLTECNHMLETFCRFGANTADDVAARQSALYEFWALLRVMEVRK